jgi:hypothetical protein
MGYVKTVIDEEYESEFFKSSQSISEKVLEVEVQGQTVERSYEDRSVYFNIKAYDFNSPETKDQVYGWLKGEEAIELGQLLIKHGTKALHANMVNHQFIHCVNLMKELIEEGRVKRLFFVVLDESPKNYGSGYRKYNIKPQWVKGKAPKYLEDFNYDDVIYWSPYPQEYKEQLEKYKVPIVFIGYDHDKEVEEFQKSIKRFN